MHEMISTGDKMIERALLVTVDFGRRDGWEAEESSRELAELATSSRCTVVDEVICRRDKPTAPYFIGKGKAEEVSSLAKEKEIEVVIFNDDLSGTQQRNLEEIIGIKAIDRTQLILDIFAQHARSIEGKLQVELAQLEYLIPRLTGKGIFLSRLGGGIGTRGPGEEKLEIDRRRIKYRIGKLKRDLENLHLRRSSLRYQRKEAALPTIALVGYTNVGKSTLLNALTGADQFVEDKLFSTLDPVARKFILPNSQKVLFLDTVGFLHRLPHHLIEAFKATLEEVVGADMLIHVLDISHPMAYQQSEAVYKVLSEIGVKAKPIITALNKIDVVENPSLIERFLKDFDNSVAISALKSKGLGELIDKITTMLSDLMADIAMVIPHHHMKLVSLIYNEGRVRKRRDRSDGIYIEAQVPVRVKRLLERI